MNHLTALKLCKLESHDYYKYNASEDATQDKPDQQQKKGNQQAFAVTD